MRHGGHAVAAVSRPCQISNLMVAGCLSATQTDAKFGSTRRTIGPARTSGQLLACTLRRVGLDWWRVC